MLNIETLDNNGIKERLTAWCKNDKLVIGLSLMVKAGYCAIATDKEGYYCRDTVEIILSKNDVKEIYDFFGNWLKDNDNDS